MFLGTRTRFNTKPAAPLRMNRNLPWGTRLLALLNDGLAGSFTVSDQRSSDPSTVNNRSTLGLGTNARWRYGMGGPCIAETSAGSETASFSWGSLFLTTQELTLAIGYQKTDTTARFGNIFGTNGGDVARCNLSYENTGVMNWDFGGDVVGTTRLAYSTSFAELQKPSAWACTTGPRGMEIWQDGILRASNAAINPTRTNSTDTHFLGRFSDLANYYWVFVHRAQLPVNLVRDITLDPYNVLFEPSVSGQSRNFFGAAATAFPWLYYARLKGG